MDARYESQEWQTERMDDADGRAALRLRDCQRRDAVEQPPPPGLILCRRRTPKVETE